jgi:hypothetical protein
MSRLPVRKVNHAVTHIAMMDGGLDMYSSEIAENYSEELGDEVLNTDPFYDLKNKNFTPNREGLCGLDSSSCEYLVNPEREVTSIRWCLCEKHSQDTAYSNAIEISDLYIQLFRIQDIMHETAHG